MTKKTIDLFCGAGGMSAGFEAAGFRSAAAVDNFDAATKTYAHAHPHSAVINASIESIDAETLAAAAGVARGELAVLTGGPPCQAYSVYNHQRGTHDARAGLFREYLRIVDGLRPEWIVMENVTGIHSINGGSVVRDIYSALAELGYAVEHQTLKAEDFGVAQERRRVVFVGTRTGSAIRFPSPTHGTGSGLQPYTTVRDAISDLPAIRNGGTGTEYAAPPRSAFQRYARAAAPALTSHKAPRLGEINLRRMQHIPQGGSWRDIPHDLLPEGMQRAKRSDHTKRYGRLHPEGLSSTILTKCDPHWSACIHPWEDRSLTVREAARLQSFPDHFTFHGSTTEQYTQVGNAVPPLLARAVASCIHDGMTA